MVAPVIESPAAPIPISPRPNATLRQDSLVEFNWNSSDSASSYQLELIDTRNAELSATSGFVPADNCVEAICSLAIDLDLPIGSSYVWQVLAENSAGVSEWSTTAIELIAGIPGEFVLSSPVGTTQIQVNTEITFVWTRAEQAVIFELAFVDGTDLNAGLEIVTINASTCTVDLCSYTATPSLPLSDLHSWQVRAINTLGETEWVSTPLTLIAEPVLLAPAPLIVSPLAGTSVLADELESFQWEEVTDALSYQFYFNDADTGPQPVDVNILPADHCENSVCSYSQVVALLPGDLHSWHVRARYADNDSEWSTTLITVVSDTVEPVDALMIDTNVSGGGFQGDVTITEDGLTVYSSADVAGVFKSTDGGLRFESRNEGLQSSKVASLAITPDNDQILYAGTGNKGTSGGLVRSVDGGDTWVLTGDGYSARFAGNHSASDDPVPNGHPRSNGDLIVVDTGENPASHTDDIVIAGSYKDGVRLFTKGGENEVSAVLTSGFVRSVARNPALPDTAFAAIQFLDSTRNGIYKIDYSSLSNPVSTLEYQTLRPEGLSVLSSGHVYGAIGDAGIVKYDGSEWVLQNSRLSISNENRQWTAVAGYVAGNNDVVYVGTNNQGGNVAGTNYSNIWRSVDGGDNWSPLVDASANVADTIYGQSDD